MPDVGNGGSGYLTLDEIRLNPFMAVAYCDDNRSCWFVAASTREKAVAKVHELKHRKRSFLRTYAVERGDGMRCPP
ncbi:hypothetical protein HAP48_0042725 [Bradyrhizobium septentrionale]|uniref:Uncharacterized protein n=1 Tax=Bradyrhizobium septentrionale TaxID=1404411 RepID=A0A974A3M4_9BRAD|nr:hypothetical protein [Bradyrhizobium septentrionale]UGY15173.1 hypothetical protein HAP48_0042725 [Bradyrhizobium septentrionale]